MYFTLHSQQYIKVKKLVTFHHEDSIKSFAVTLNERQFQNLVDFVKNINNFNTLVWIPLEDGVWLYYNYPAVKIIDNEVNVYFRFHKSSWKTFIRTVYKRVASFLSHNVVRSGERHAADDGYSRYQSRRISSQIRRQNLSRKARDDCQSTHEQTKYSSFPKRSCTNSRQCSNGRSGKNGGRIRLQIENDSTPYTSIESSDDEHGSESKDAIPGSSPQYSIE